VGINRWRKKAKDRSVWAITLKEALVKLQGLYTNEEEETADQLYLRFHRNLAYTVICHGSHN
jgi:hypothetical protein